MHRTVLALLAFVGIAAHAAELKPATNAAFDKYVSLTELSQRTRRAHSGFLWSTDHTEMSRKDLLQGKVYIERLNTCELGKAVDVPDGLIHHWIGVAFVPGASVDDALHLVQDYNNHKYVYQPDVIDSNLISRDGNRYRARLRFMKRKVLTVVIDTEHEADYVRVSATRAYSHSRTTLVREVENPGERRERLRKPGDDQGFLWRLNSYWNFEQKDGGVYIECEAITLTRDVPPVFGALIKPFTDSIPRESLCDTLTATRGEF